MGCPKRLLGKHQRFVSNGRDKPFPSPFTFLWGRRPIGSRLAPEPDRALTLGERSRGFQGSTEASRGNVPRMFLLRSVHLRVQENLQGRRSHSPKVLRLIPCTEVQGDFVQCGSPEGSASISVLHRSRRTRSGWRWSRANSTANLSSTPCGVYSQGYPSTAPKDSIGMDVGKEKHRPLAFPPRGQLPKLSTGCGCDQTDFTRISTRNIHPLKSAFDVPKNHVRIRKTWIV